MTFLFNLPLRKMNTAKINDRALSQNAKIQQDMVHRHLVSANILYEKFLLRQLPVYHTALCSVKSCARRHLQDMLII